MMDGKRVLGAQLNWSERLAPYQIDLGMFCHYVNPSSTKDRINGGGSIVW